MRVVRALGVMVAGVAVCSLAGAGELVSTADAPRPSTFKSGVDVVALNVTVIDPEQRPIGDLGRQDFAVFEDGVQQQISYFETSVVPLDLAILVDTSVSMGPKLPFVKKAATTFAGLLRPGDRAAVLGFSNQVHVLTPFTDNLAEVTGAIDRTQAGGATALYNAVYVALREFGRAVAPGDPVRRRAIVVLSDGEDTASLLSFDEMLAEARRAGVTVYTIGLRTDAFTSGSSSLHAAVLLAGRLRDEGPGAGNGGHGSLPATRGRPRRGLRGHRPRALASVRDRVRLQQSDAQRRLPARRGQARRSTRHALAHPRRLHRRVGRARRSRLALIGGAEAPPYRTGGVEASPYQTVGRTFRSGAPRDSQDGSPPEIAEPEP